MFPEFVAYRQQYAVKEKNNAILLLEHAWKYLSFSNNLNDRDLIIMRDAWYEQCMTYIATYIIWYMHIYIYDHIHIIIYDIYMYIYDHIYNIIILYISEYYTNIVVYLYI